ncbi:MAG: DNA replication/repair protein RecF [Clostridia bacterium]|nr:DNA replication/repair protein RecF [Clostridia bacterium]MBR3270779.1 DNA replication/repair protein RecF [Clostridia bacterium]
MRIRGLKLSHYRNYDALELSPDPGLNVFEGLNAAGKTNILESIFLCALGRSHRTARDAELLQEHEPFGGVRLYLDTRGGSRSIRIELCEGERKKVYIDDAATSRSGELMGCLNVVMFSPEDLQLVKDGPAERRRFLDMELSQMKPAYYYDLQQYNNALKNRNLLLKETPIRYDMIELWDEQLARLGSRIIRERTQFVQELSGLAHELHRSMSGGKENLRVTYEPSVPYTDEERLAETLQEQLAERLERDIFRGFTSVGPHRDDLGLMLNGRDVRVFGSQGQQRTTALSLKLSEIELIKRTRGERPVLLLDDVFSELDADRQARLLEVVSDCQAFVTCTHLEEFASIETLTMQVWHVENGRVSEV